MRYQNVSKSNRVFADIRLKTLVLTGEKEEILTEDWFDVENETVHVAEFITEQPSVVTFTYHRGEVSYPKALNPGRVVTFQDLPPIKSIVVQGVAGTTLEVAIAL